MVLGIRVGVCAEEARPGAVNGADSYKKAFTIYDGLSAQEQAVIRGSALEPNGAFADTLYEKVQPMMELLKEGRRAGNVDWKLGKPSFFRPFPNLSEMQKLVYAVRFEAGRKFRTDGGDAVEDVTALEAMGRSAPRNLLGALVYFGIHAMGTRMLAQGAASIPASADADLAYFLDPEEPARMYEEGIKGEAAFLRAVVAEYKNPATRSGSDIVKYAGDPKADTEKLDADGLCAGCTWLAETDEGIAMRVRDPEPEFQKWWSERATDGARVKVSGEILSGLENLRARMQGTEAFNAMLKAGLALERNDNAGFEKIVDPASGKPFAYAASGAGFVLTTATNSTGKALSLDFTKPVSR